MLLRLFPEHHFVSLDLPTEAEQAEKEPRAFLERHTPPVIIDEVQYAPGLFRHLKAEIDSKRAANGRFLLTGSQKFALMKNVSESLAGRADIMELETLSFAEIRAALPETELETAIVRGGFPELYANPDIDPVAFYNSYLRRTSNATSARWQTSAACVTSRGSCGRVRCVPPTFSTRPIWPATWASRPRPPTSGSRCLRPRDKRCCSNHGSRTGRRLWSRARSSISRTPACSARY